MPECEGWDSDTKCTDSGSVRIPEGPQYFTVLCRFHADRRVERWERENPMLIWYLRQKGILPDGP